MVISVMMLSLGTLMLALAITQCGADMAGIRIAFAALGAVWMLFGAVCLFVTL